MAQGTNLTIRKMVTPTDAQKRDPLYIGGAETKFSGDPTSTIAAAHLPESKGVTGQPTANWKGDIRVRDVNDKRYPPEGGNVKGRQ